MALTEKEKQYWMEILETTNNNREEMFALRTVPDEYMAYMEKVIRSEEMIDVPLIGIPVKCYISMAENRCPGCTVYIHIHGGGFHYPWTEDDALFCAKIAHETKGIVVDVDYALTPKHSFPVPVEQVYEVARWTAGRCAEWNADSEKIAIGGCSAGGNIAASVCLLAEQRGDIKFCLQILDCAALDNATPPEYKPEADLLMMPSERMNAFAALYVGGDKQSAYSPFISPSFAPDNMLESQPPALIITAGKCSLRFEDELYGKRLAALGVEVTMKRFSNSRHAFTVRMMDEWQEAHEVIIRRLKMLNL